MDLRLRSICNSKRFFFTLGIDENSNRHYLSIPMSNSLVDYQEYYWLTEGQWEVFCHSEEAAGAFAESCRERKHDDQLILGPAPDRGVPRVPA